MNSADELERMQLRFDALLHAPGDAREIRARLVEAAYRHHLARNPTYRAYAAAVLGRDPEDARLDEIPLLPSGLFKRTDLRLASVPEATIAKWCASSGTLGSRSVVPRDDDTLGHFLSSVSASLPALFDLERLGDHRGVVLGPDSETAGDLWFSYVIACITVMMEAEHFQRDGDFLVDEAALAIRTIIEGGKSPLVIGPPFRILQLAEHIEQIAHWPSFPDDAFVVSAGGWKNERGKAIGTNAFRARVAGAFRMRSESQIRDSFNMVELNSVINECSAHVKHAPPWLEVQSRDPKTNRVLPPGESGVLAFLDPSASSYPCFVLSEDVGTVTSGRCACGREGSMLHVERRLERVEARGCALRMAVGGAAAREPNARFFQSVFRRPL
jgi:long-chain-fatty-acid---luciferin-component ligase